MDVTTLRAEKVFHNGSSFLRKRDFQIRGLLEFCFGTQPRGETNTGGSFITICGDYKKSLECSAAGSRLADSLVITEERRQLDKVVAMAQAQVKAPLLTGKAKRVDDETQFQAAKDKKRVALDTSDPAKFVVVGAGLSSK